MNLIENGSKRTNGHFSPRFWQRDSGACSCPKSRCVGRERRRWQCPGCSISSSRVPGTSSSGCRRKPGQAAPGSCRLACASQCLLAWRPYRAVPIIGSPNCSRPPARRTRRDCCMPPGPSPPARTTPSQPPGEPNDSGYCRKIRNLRVGYSHIKWQQARERARFRHFLATRHRALAVRDRSGAIRAIDDALAAAALAARPMPSMPVASSPAAIPAPAPPAPTVTYALLPGHWQLAGARYVWVPPETSLRWVEDRPFVQGRYVWRGGAWRWVPSHFGAE